MPKGGWLLLLTIGGLVSGSAPNEAHPPEVSIVIFNGDVLECDSYGCWKRSVTKNPKEIDGKENASGKAENNNDTAQNWPIIQFSTHYDQEQRVTDEETKRAERDIAAQEAMARWAMVSAIAAILALGGLIWTLWETRRIGQAQVRAYLSIAEIDLSAGLGDAFLLNFHIHNCGASPARNVKITAVCELFIRETMGAQSTDLDSQDEKNITIEVNSVAAEVTEKRMDSTPDFTPEIERQLNTTHQGIDVEVRGHVSWNDVFGRGHSQHFTFSSMDVSWWMFEERDDNGNVKYKPLGMMPETLLRP